MKVMEKPKLIEELLWTIKEKVRGKLFYLYRP